MTWAIRARVFSRLQRASGPPRWRAACLYFGAGCLAVSDFRGPSLARWEAYTDDTTGLLPWEEDLYGLVIRPSDRVLLIGCGTGRDLLALRQQGCDVTGLEQSATLAEQARTRLSRSGLTTAVIAMPVESFASDDVFDVVVFAPYTYSYILGTGSRVRILRRMCERLSPGGKVIITYAVLRPQSPLWILLARIGSVCARSDWWPEPGDRIHSLDANRRALAFEHQFLPDELAHECGSAGLRVERDEAISSFFRFAVASA